MTTDHNRNLFTASVPVSEQATRKQFPFVYRISSEHSVGVKAFVGKLQYGNVVPLDGKHPDEVLDVLESDLRREMEAIP